MSDFKNRIITISGNPSSGKSTVIRKLKNDYEEKGYNVHIYSVGHEFRKIADERGITIEELNEYMSKRSEIDELIDSTVSKRGAEINSKERPKDIFIFDSRLAFHNIPDSFSIRLTADDNVAGKRAFEDKDRGYSTIEEAIQETMERKINEVERYGKRYGIDLQDPNNYNLVIDTSFSTIEDICEVIEQGLELELKGETYAKMWTSPKRLLPLQGERDTLGQATYTIDEMVAKIKEEGYDQRYEIEALEVDKKLYILEGHHRNFASGYLGKTLVPYVVLAKDDETIPGYGEGNTARKYANSLTLTKLYGHEWILDKKGGPKFSYEDVYPGIYKELREKDARGR